MTVGADLADNLFARTRGTATTGSSDGANAFAFLALDADFADRFETLGNGVIIGRSLNAQCPQGQYGSLGCQDFSNQVHPFTLIVAYHARSRCSHSLGPRERAQV